MNPDTPPIGIIITLPARFFVLNSMEVYVNHINKVAEDKAEPWERIMKNLPKHDILYVYTVYDGKIQHRMNLVEIWRNKTKRFIQADGKWRTFENVNGISTAGPVVWAPRDIPQKGFQGFKYVYEEIF